MSLVIVWLVSSIVGFLAASYGVYEAFTDRRAIGKADHAMHLIAGQRLFAQIVRATIMGAWALIGFGAIGTAPQVSAALLVLVAGNVAYTTLSLTDIYVGRRVRREIAQQLVRRKR